MAVKIRMPTLIINYGKRRQEETHLQQLSQLLISNGAQSTNIGPSDRGLVAFRLNCAGSAGMAAPLRPPPQDQGHLTKKNKLKLTSRQENLITGENPIKK